MKTPIRVLIVEDSPDDTTLLLLELEGGGYAPLFERVDTATAMQTALAKQPWDIIIADYSMPHFSALAALQLLQDSGLDLPFIIVSGAIGEDTAVAAMKAGAHDYLMKDNLTRLVPAVERELREAQVRQQRTQAEKMLAAEARFLRAQTAVAQMALSSLHPEVLLPRLLETSCRVQGYAYGFLWRVVEGGHEAVTVACFGEETAPLLGFCQALSDSGSFVSRTIRTGQPAFCNRVQESPYGAHPSIQTLRPQAVLALPLCQRTGGIIGCLEFVETEDPERFTEQDLAQGVILASQIVQALENSQLFSQVQRLQDQYRVVTESLNDAVYTVDLQERITFGNAALERLTGYRVQELVGHPSLALYTAGAVLAIRGRQRRSGEPVPFHLEAAIRRKDGTEVPVELSVASLILEGQMVGRVIVARDITERKYLEEQLCQSQKLEAVGELAAGVAHELGNALGIIGSSVQYLLKGCAEGHPFYEFLEVIHRNVVQADRTITGLLSFARPRRPSPAPVDITRLLEGTCQLLKGEVAKQHIQVILRFPPDVPWVMADPEQLQQVFLNLLLNAVQAMPEGGVVTLTAIVDPEGKQVQIAVVDTGLGIPQEHLNRIFDPFFTTKEGGTGLGLSVSARLIRAQGGRISVNSREGKGSVFTIFLPAVAAGGAMPREC
jgi:two-component system, cell cycle sensor histidine kinase and response regulator CckA